MVSVLIVALSIAYYIVIFLPSKERARQLLEQQKVQVELQETKKQETKEKAISECTTKFLNAMDELFKQGKHYTNEEIKTMTNYAIDICLKQKGYAD